MSVVAVATLCTSLAAPGLASAEQGWIYHFDPDSGARNPGKFKAVMNAFVRTLDPDLAFQPFRKHGDLDEQLARVAPRYMIVSVAWLSANKKRLDLRTVLVSTRRGSTTFRRVLVTRDKALNPKTLTGHSVAATSLNDRASFDHSFGELGLKRGQLRVVSVSKDVDALLALAVGQVDMALVRPESIPRVGRVNPNATAGLITLYTSPPVGFAPLVAVGPQPEALTKTLVDGFRKAGSTRLGRRTMRMLGIDAWRAPGEVPR